MDSSESGIKRGAASRVQARNGQPGGGWGYCPIPHSSEGLKGCAMIRAVIFDLDGTLVDSFADIACAANHALGLLGRETLPMETVKSQVGRGLRNLMKGLLPGSSETEIDAAVEEVKRYYEDHPTDHAVLYPGARETLNQLGEIGIKRGVLSNKLDSLVKKIARNLDFESRMEAVWGHREGWPLKPDATSLLAILEEFGTDPTECLIVGDADPDRVLAENSGAHFCAVTFGMTPKSEWLDLGCEFMVDRLSEVPEVVMRVNRSTSSSAAG